MQISFVIPAYRASATIGATLSSIFDPELPGNWTLDVIVVDDGSPDGEDLKRIVSSFPPVRYSRFASNRGKYAAVDAGIHESKGDFVIIFDADDTLVEAWPKVFARVLESWPEECALCFSACRTQFGESTVSCPEYTGWLTFEDLLQERRSGEYIAIFRGDQVHRAIGYRDPKTGWGCEMLTYLHYAKTGGIWVSAEVLRTYHVAQPGSVTASLSNPAGARQIRRCHELVLETFEADFRRLAPVHYRRRRLRQAVFAAIAGDRDALALWRKGVSWATAGESLGVACLIALGGRGAMTVAGLAKRLGLIKKFG